MRGAAIFGLKPKQILSRIIPVTIGVDNYKIIKENDECEISDRNINGDLVCLSYKIFVKKSQPIKTNHDSEPEIIKPINETINIYYSFDDKINEKNKHFLDTIEIPLSELPLENRTISVSMRFSNYINVTVTDKESKDSNSKIIYYPF